VLPPDETVTDQRVRFSESMLEPRHAALDLQRRPADHDGPPSPLRSAVL